ncbi:MAG: DPP IV N-terminal domain-containing protein, partial [Candidatus Aminicenantes bacterium]|nr:DPP IV N-terminal domain-containing protein [Candidatus Aminicenantes bacterium]
DKLVFKSWRTGSMNLWILDLKSNASRQCTFHNKHIYGDPTWSPDGEQIGYITDGAAYILDIASGNTKAITKQTGSINSFSISFSPEKGLELVNLNTDIFPDVLFVDENNPSRWYLSKFYSDREEKFSQLVPSSFWSPSGQLNMVFLKKIWILGKKGNLRSRFHSPHGALRKGNSKDWPLDDHVVWSEDENLAFFSFNKRVIYRINIKKGKIIHFFSSKDEMKLLSYLEERNELVCFRFRDQSVCSIKGGQCEKIIQTSEMFTVNLIDRINKNFNRLMELADDRFDRIKKRLCFFSKDQQQILVGLGFMDLTNKLKWNIPDSDDLFLFAESELGAGLSTLVDYIEKSHATDFSISKDKQTIITIVPKKSVFSIEIKQINELQN